MSNTPSTNAALIAADAPLRDAADAPLREVLRIRLRRFDRSFRPRLRKLAERSSRLADLLYVFPGAAVALAAGDRSAGAREHAARLIEKGRPLPEIAKALELPMWLKRLPPEAFRQAPRGLSHDVIFGRNIANFLPDSPEKSALWMNRLTFALAACGPAFALWLARQRLACQSLAASSPVAQAHGGASLLPLAAFAWLSSNTETPAHSLTPSPWRDTMSFANAVQETFAWLNRIVFELRPRLKSSGTEDDDWRQTHVRQGICFAPLLTKQELREEGMRMHNCVASYADRVAKGQCQIYSVRLGGLSVANMEIRRGCSGDLIVAQLRGPGNAAPPEFVTQAAKIWFAHFTEREAPVTPASVTWVETQVSPQRWEKIWRPYWEAKPQFETLLRVPEPATLMRLQMDVAMLKQWASCS